MKDVERTGAKSNVSRIERGRSSPCEHTSVETSRERTIRLKMEAEEARYRRRREEADARERYWKDRLITRAVVFCVLGLCALCAAVMLSGSYTTPEAKEWAITTLKYGVVALGGYVGRVAQKLNA